MKCPGGRVIAEPPSGSYWRVSEEKFWELNADKRIWWGDDGNNVLAQKIFLSEVKAGRVPQTLWFYKDIGHSQESKRAVLEILPVTNSEAVFETPKPRKLIRRILDLAFSEDGNDLVLDFFVGSGTTAHAVLLQNGADGGSRRFVRVQLPATLEPSALLEDGSRSTTISDITKELIRRTSRKVRGSNLMVSGDLGFRVFKLDSSNLRVWEPNGGNLDKMLLDSIEHGKTDRSEWDGLYELLLKLCLDPMRPDRETSGKEIHVTGGRTLFACVARTLERETGEPVAHAITAWRAELTSAGEATCVFRDSAFADDVAKSNMAAILEQNGIAKVRSV